MSDRPSTWIGKGDAETTGSRAVGRAALGRVHFGRWNGPHPDEKLNGKEWFEVWRAWNVAHGFAFDGCDWDLEGNDDASQNLSEAMVALVADFCREAKQHGYLIALAPAESYLDAGSAEVDLLLNHEPRAPWRPGENGFPAAGFPYAGRNAYAAVLARAGMDSVDAVSVQLYEGYSSACYALATRGGAALSAYAEEVAAGLSTKGVTVGADVVRVPREKLLLGRERLGGQREIHPSGARRRRARRGSRGLAGAMFWVIDEEGFSYDRGAVHGLRCLLGVPRSCVNLFCVPFLYSRSMLRAAPRHRCTHRLKH